MFATGVGIRTYKIHTYEIGDDGRIYDVNRRPLPGTLL